MFERFTQAARSVVVRAQQQARTAGHREIGAADLLMAVLEDPDQVPGRVLRQLGVPDPVATPVVETTFDDADAAALGSIGIDLDAVRRRAEDAFGPGAFDRRRRQRPGLFGRRSEPGHIPFNAEAKAALELALREAHSEGHRYLGAEHIFLGLLATEQRTALGMLQQLGVTEDRTELHRLVLAELARAA